MNCKDICRVLDERDLAELSARETSHLRAHTSRCDDCAGQILAAESIAGFRSEMPPMPAALQERARQLSGLCASQPATCRSRRPLIIGGLLLLGAAATMFAVVPHYDDRATG